MVLRPAPPPAEELTEEQKAEKEAMAKEAAEKAKEEEPAEFEYVKLSNQFVVPVVKKDRVAALVVLTLTLEVAIGTKSDVLLREAKIRDSFLQVLFDHANHGGFDGEFTSPKKIDHLRLALREIAQRDFGSDVVNDVLLIEIARQDY